MILLIDNYDSFSYNVVQLVGGLCKKIKGMDIKVIRNDEMTVAEVEKLAPTHIILSPGAGRPADAGICEAVVQTMKGKCRILGICLGHQGICETFGANITYAGKLMHGKQSSVKINNNSVIFKGLPDMVKVARYHSLVADKNSIPEQLEVIAEDETGEVMAVQHKDYDIFGLQFHPESVMTPQGSIIMRNFLELA